MPISHVVEPGDCMTSIADRYGFFWQTLWDHAENAELKQRRGDPHALCPGDVVHVPDRRVETVSCAHEQRHVFRRKGVPARFEVRLVRDEKPRAGEAYVLEIDGTPQEGSSDGDGWIRAWIPPSARKGKLVLEDGLEVHELELGHLDPLAELRGVQGRLRNLGWYDGPIDGEQSDALRVAIVEFQREHLLEATGEPDDETLAKLEEVHAR